MIIFLPLSFVNPSIRSFIIVCYQHIIGFAERIFITMLVSWRVKTDSAFNMLFTSF